MAGKEPVLEAADVYDQDGGDIKNSSDTVKEEDTTGDAPLELRLICAMALAMAALVFVSSGVAMRSRMLSKSNTLQSTAVILFFNKTYNICLSVSQVVTQVKMLGYH